MTIYNRNNRCHRHFLLKHLCWRINRILDHA